MPYVKATTGGGTGTSLNVPITATAGNLLVVYVHYDTNVASVISASDGSNTYSLIDSSSGIGLSTLYALYAKNITGGSLTVAISATISVTMAVTILEFSGCDTAAPLDATAKGLNSSSGVGQDITSGSFTAASGTLIVIGGGNYYTPTWVVSATNPTGMAIATGATLSRGDANGNVTAAYTTSGSPYTGTAGLKPTGQTFGNVIVASFKPLPSGGAPSMMLLGVG